MPDRLIVRLHFIDARNNFYCASKPVKKILSNARSPMVGGALRHYVISRFQPTSAISRGFEPPAGRQRREKFLSTMPDRLLAILPSTGLNAIALKPAIFLSCCLQKKNLKHFTKPLDRSKNNRYIEYMNISAREQ